MTAVNHVVRAIRQTVPTLVKNAEQVRWSEDSGMCCLVPILPFYLFPSLVVGGVAYCNARPSWDTMTNSHMPGFYTESDYSGIFPTCVSSYRGNFFLPNIIYI